MEECLLYFNATCARMVIDFYVLFRRKTKKDLERLIKWTETIFWNDRDKNITKMIDYLEVLTSNPETDKRLLKKARSWYEYLYDRIAR